MTSRLMAFRCSGINSCVGAKLSGRGVFVREEYAGESPFVSPFQRSDFGRRFRGACLSEQSKDAFRRRLRPRRRQRGTPRRSSASAREYHSPSPVQFVQSLNWRLFFDHRQNLLHEKRSAHRAVIGEMRGGINSRCGRTSRLCGLAATDFAPVDLVKAVRRSTLTIPSSSPAFPAARLPDARRLLIFASPVLAWSGCTLGVSVFSRSTIRDPGANQSGDRQRLTCVVREKQGQSVTSFATAGMVFGVGHL